MTNNRITGNRVRRLTSAATALVMMMGVAAMGQTNTTNSPGLAPLPGQTNYPTPPTYPIVNSSGVLLWPTNLFAQNSNLLNASVSGGGGGGGGSATFAQVAALAPSGQEFLTNGESVIVNVSNNWHFSSGIQIDAGFSALAGSYVTSNFLVGSTATVGASNQVEFLDRTGGKAFQLNTNGPAWFGSNVTVGGRLNKWAFTAPTTAATLTAGGDSLTYTMPSTSQTLVGTTSTDTLSNKRVTARVTTIASSATPTVNSDSCDCVTITALAADITSMSSSLSGTPSNFDQLEYRIKDNGSPRGITWGASFVAGPAALPTTTTTSKALHAYFEWDSVQSKWVCLSTGSDS